MYKIWKCLNCNRINYSIDKRHHEMNICECGKSGVDFEIYYSRIMGNITHIKELDYNFFDELVLCLHEQGYNVLFEFNGRKFINLETVNLCRKFEDEILIDFSKTFK
jgi:hypothetical protein